MLSTLNSLKTRDLQESKEILYEFPLEKYKKNYKVSNLGKIWSNRKKEYLKTFVSDGFEFFYINDISLKSKKFQSRVDIIVAKSFLGVKDEIQGTYLEHIDGNKLNNNLSNLRWTTIELYLQEKYNCLWKQISDIDKYYISDTGLVWSERNDILIKQQVSAGYYSVVIGYPNNKIFHVHRLVALNFIPNLNTKLVVNHKDHNKLNNNLTNLEWVTQSENVTHGLLKVKKLPSKNDSCEPPKYYKELDWLPSYLVTKEGRIYSNLSKTYLTPSLNDNGYYRANINNKKIYIHRLVAEAFLGKPSDPNINQVNHKNMNRLDNNIENLEWVSCSANNKHKTINNPDQYKHLQKKVACINKETKEMIRVYNGIKEASRDTGVNSGSIVKVCKNLNKSAGNYIWRYFD
jgi:hypothetical protein